MRLRLSRRAVLVLSVALLGPALPSLAAGPDSSVIAPLVRSTALSVGATTATLGDTDQLVGVTWASGTPEVHVRWLTAQGWTEWDVPEDNSDVPDPAERAGTRGGTEPAWRPPGATLVGVRVAGAAQDLQLVRVGDGAARAGWSFGTASAAAAGTAMPGTRSRAEWGADESIRRKAPSYASSVKAVVVHHTAGSNDYGPADVPRRIRADYAYHVQARGWEDLGYNVVVDKFGGIWEGRAGGLDRAVIGSHAAGFNTGTLGVSLIGNMSQAQPTVEAVRAVARVSSYAAARWQFDPQGTVVLTSGGSPKYRSGVQVRLPRVHGHRDTGRTACPGSLYDRLGEVRGTAAVLLGPPPRVTAVQLTGAPVRAPGPLVIAAELSRPASGFVALFDPDGALVVQVVGDSATPRLEWNGLRPGPVPVPALPGIYTWLVETGDGIRPPDRRSGTFEVAPPGVPVPFLSS